MRLKWQRLKAQRSNQTPSYLLRVRAMGCSLRNGILLVIGVLALALPTSAQVQVGDNLRMNLNGTVATGYTASDGNTGVSSHGLDVGGNAQLNGSYFNPQFLSFTVQPYYNRSQANSAFQSITDSSGVSSSVNIFSGSHFPGYITFNKSLNSTGQFGIPGSESLTTHGDTTGYTIGWSERLPDLPSLSASYSSDSSSSSIFGSDATTDTMLHNLTLRSDYKLKGFRLNGTFMHLNSEGSFPALVTGETEAVRSESSSNNYQISASHSFPMHGSFAVAANRLNYSYDSTNSSPHSGVSDSVSGNLNFHPLNKLALAFSSSYNDNLIGILPQQLQGAGSAGSNSGTFRSMLASADAYYQVLPRLSVHASVSRQDQSFLGQEFGSTQFGANANYSFSRKLFGSLTFSGGVVDSANKQGNSSLGFYGNVNFSRKIDGFDLNGGFTYSQNVQTLLAVYTTSSYTYLASVSRKLRDRLYWSGSYSGGRSGFVQVEGSENHSEQISSSLTYRRYALAGQWSTSSGVAVLTPTGLVPVAGSLPASALGLEGVQLFDAKAWGVSLGASPLRMMTITASYSHANGDSKALPISTSNQTQMLSMLMRYKFRKIYFNAGFTRFRQGITTLDARNPSVPGTPPSMVSSYYFGISRWFDFF
jgi:hypothetical protein